MTLGLGRVSWIFLGLVLWLVLFALGLYSLITHPPRIILSPPPAPLPRGGLYAQDGTPLAVTLEAGRYYPLKPSASQL